MLGYHPTWEIFNPGTGACSLNATDNTQGRLLNGVAPGSVCGTAASGYSGTFLHVEQDPGFRTASDWIPAVQDTWPTGVPAAPTNLTATAGNQQVSLAWNASSGASSYSAHRSTLSGGPYTTVATGIPGTSHTDPGLTNGTLYHYVVTALNGNGESGNSNQASATPQAPQPPPAPTNLTASSPSKKKITLNWTAAPGATSYRVKRSTVSGGPYALVASPSGTSYTNTGLQSGTTYYYVVAAVNAAGEGPSSSQASATAR
jgi:fibronectin type 3 domain-containing protein